MSPYPVNTSMKDIHKKIRYWLIESGQIPPITKAEFKIRANYLKNMTFEELQESYAQMHGYVGWHEIEDDRKLDAVCIGFAKFCLVQNLLERDDNKEQIDALCKKAAMFDGLVNRIELQLLTDKYGNHIGHAFDWLSSENSEAIAVILENFYNNDAAL